MPDKINNSLNCTQAINRENDGKSRSAAKRARACLLPILTGSETGGQRCLHYKTQGGHFRFKVTCGSMAFNFK